MNLNFVKKKSQLAAEADQNTTPEMRTLTTAEAQSIF